MKHNQRDYGERAVRIALYSPIVKRQAKTNAVIHCMGKTKHRQAGSKQAAPNSLEHLSSRISFEEGQ